MRARHCAVLAALAVVLPACTGSSAPPGAYAGTLDHLTSSDRGLEGGSRLTISFTVSDGGSRVTGIRYQARVECKGDGSSYSQMTADTDIDGSGNFRAHGPAAGYFIDISGHIGADGTASGAMTGSSPDPCGVDGDSWHARLQH
ncbi:MAG: hypothetical protein ABR498_01000 [Candidatus Dormibacteria bacterium]